MASGSLHPAFSFCCATAPICLAGGELRGFQSPPPPTPTQPVPGDFRVSEFHLPLISRGCLFVFAEIEVKSAHRTVPSTWWELKK